MILMENPNFLYDAAFQLSFGAVIGIGLLCPLLDDMLSLYKSVRKSEIKIAHGIKCRGRKIYENFIRLIRQGISVSLAPQLATLPIVMWNFYQLSSYGIIVNLLIIPPMGLLLATGIVAGFIGDAVNMLTGITDLPVVVLRATSLIISAILYSSYLILTAYEKLAKLCGGLFGNLWITGKPAFGQVIAYYALLMGGLLVYWRHKQKQRAEVIRPEYKYLRRILIKEGLVFICAVCILSFRASAEFELHALSVGQGECAMIKGKNTPVILIDGGSNDEKQVGKYRILPCLKANTINRIDYVFISHLDNDHVNGILEILEYENCGIAIEQIILPKTVAMSETNASNNSYTALVNLARQRGVPIYLMEAQNSIVEDGLRITCLSPYVSGSDEWRKPDANENSLVLEIEYIPIGFRALFTGDIGVVAEREMMARMRPIHYLKVAHHGSRTSTSTEFLEMTEPQVAVVSAGEGNRYGHPHEETMERLNEIITYVTYEKGQISLKIKGKRVTIDTFL